MKSKQMESFFKVLMGLAALTIVVGTYLKISHHTKGELIMSLGFLSYLLILTLENSRLNKIIKELKEENTTADSQDDPTKK